ncbi:MAG: sugar phosphate isomerase/epimerase [Rubellimicrobium sp.]|nr:sugar phosphate isomerase/epimerase [Rubellimicrobium sp.]
MKIGFSLLLWTTEVGRPHWPVLQALKAAGYDGAEIPVTGSTPAACAQLRGVMADMGLIPTASGGVPDASVNPMSLDAGVAQAGIDHLKRLVDRAVALGAEVLIGPFTQPLAEFSGSGPTGAEWAALVRAHQAMADHAGDALRLAVEPLNRFECYALNTAAQAARLVAEVGRPNYGWLYDTFHANIEEADPAGVIGTCRPTHIHISENDRGIPGRGHIDFAAAFAALRAAGYDDWLTVEAFGQALPDLAAATRIWRPLFDSPEQVYTEAITLIRKGWAEAATEKGESI